MQNPIILQWAFPLPLFFLSIETRAIILGHGTCFISRATHPEVMHSLMNESVDLLACASSLNFARSWKQLGQYIEAEILRRNAECSCWPRNTHDSQSSTHTQGDNVHEFMTTSRFPPNEGLLGNESLRNQSQTSLTTTKNTPIKTRASFPRCEHRQVARHQGQQSQST